MNKPDKKQCPVEALHRGLLLLEHLIQIPDGLKLSELSERLELQSSTVHNLLKTLVYSGYAENTAGTYRLGRRLPALLRQRRLESRDGLPQLMSSLSNELGEALVLAQLSEGRRRILCSTQCNQAVQVSVSYIEQNARGLWSLETGIILAAYASPEELEQLLAVNGLPESHSRAEIDNYLSGIRSIGYVTLSHPSLYGVSVPVLSPDGQLLAALGTHLPLYRLPSDGGAALLTRLKNAAEQISEFIELSFQ